MENIDDGLKKIELLIERNEDFLLKDLEPIEISALVSCMRDCHKSFVEVYCTQLNNILSTAENDYESLHDCIVDIYFELNHIKNHVIDSEKGFEILINILANK